MAGVLWALPLLIALETISNDTNPWVRYAVLILLVGYPYCECPANNGHFDVYGFRNTD